MRYFTIAVLLFLCSFANAQQNLVPNPSFEDSMDCVNNNGEFRAFLWENPNIASPDYYSEFVPCSVSSLNNPSGYQLPNSGLAYSGLYLWNNGPSREYIEAKLIDSLKANKHYKVSLYISRADRCNSATDAFGIYFSNNFISSPLSASNFPFTPQVTNISWNFIVDTLNWINITDTILAVGGEQYLTIGNFYPDSLTNIISVPSMINPFNGAYIYIDDVSVVLIDSISSIKQNEELIPFYAFPNPIKDDGIIYLNGLSNELNNISSIFLSDITAKTIEIKYNRFSPKTIKIETPNISNGIYFLSICTQHSKIILKLLK